VISGYNYQYEELNSNNITLEVKATNDIHISFAPEKNPDGQNLNEIVIGGWGNQQSVIRRGMQGSNLAAAQTPSFLSNEEFRGFWITSVIIEEGREISVGKIGEENPFMSGIDSNPLNWSYIGLGCWHGVTCSYKYVNQEPTTSTTSELSTATSTASTTVKITEPSTTTTSIPECYPLFTNNVLGATEKISDCENLVCKMRCGKAEWQTEMVDGVECATCV